MKSQRNLINIIQFVIVCGWLIVSLTTMVSNNYVIQWQHYLAMIMLLANGFLFYKHHKLCVLFFGLLLVLALVGILSFNVGIVGSTVYWQPGGANIPIFSGNPYMIFILVIHFILSGRNYLGIATKRYWKDLLPNTN